MNKRTTIIHHINILLLFYYYFIILLFTITIIVYKRIYSIRSLIIFISPRSTSFERIAKPFQISDLSFRI